MTIKAMITGHYFMTTMKMEPSQQTLGKVKVVIKNNKFKIPNAIINKLNL